ncbi:MAG TPA: R3H domain-containing nucleic acid-binding protein [Bdellovibrionota bacterium]|nr:R3H domain-containing nucleic acid-binding protein [Bdellovibrionota bacterium]
MKLESCEEKVKAFLNQLAELIPQEVSFSVSRRAEENKIVVEVEGEEAADFVDEKLFLQEALQHLIWKIIKKEYIEDDLTPHVVVQNTQARSKYLEALAKELSEKAIQTGEEMALPPLNSFERRIVHLALSEHSGVTTKSVGEGSLKKILIIPNLPS